MKKIRVLLVGLGRIGSTLEADPYRKKPCTHAGTLLSSAGKKMFQIVSISDTNDSAVETFMKSYKLSNLKSSYSQRFLSPTIYGDLLSIKNPSFPSIDLAVIATNSETHYPLARKLIQLGIKNLLVEKPVSLFTKEAVLLQKLARKEGVRIWVNHERRYHPVYSWAREGLLTGRWGKIKTIHASILTSALDPGHAFHGKGTGPLIHDGTHVIDFLHWLLGSPNKILAEASKSHKKYKLDEQVLAWLQYNNGVHVFLEVGGYRKYFQFSIEIQTTDVKIILSNDGFQFWETKNSKLYKGFRSLIRNPHLPPKKILSDSNPFPLLYKSIYNSITNDLPVQEGSIDDNVAIVKILESIQNSIHKSHVIKK